MTMRTAVNKRRDERELTHCRAGRNGVRDMGGAGV